jgi:hypothetical protein
MPNETRLYVHGINGLTVVSYDKLCAQQVLATGAVERSTVAVARQLADSAFVCDLLHRVEHDLAFALKHPSIARVLLLMLLLLRSKKVRRQWMQSINQSKSIIQSINKSINHSINQSFNCEHHIHGRASQLASHPAIRPAGAAAVARRSIPKRTKQAVKLTKGTNIRT